MQKGALQTILLIIVGALVISGGAYYLGTKQAAAPEADPNELELATTTSKPATQSATKPVEQSKPVAPDSGGDWKTYQNAKYGVEFKYPSIGKINEQYLMASGRTTSNYSISVGLPVSSWQEKKFSVVIYTKAAGQACAEVVSNLFSNNQTIGINGLYYHWEDPSMVDTSGMNSTVKLKSYGLETKDRCYLIEGRLSEPKTSNPDLSELLMLDQIMQTFKLTL